MTLGDALGLVSTIAVCWAAFSLWGIRRTLTRPTVEQRLQRMRAQTAVNLEMLETSSARRELARYYLAEAGVMSFLLHVDEEVANAGDIDLQAVLDRLEKQDENWWTRTKGWLKKNGGRLGEKVLDKINDLVKSSLPGGPHG